MQIALLIIVSLHVLSAVFWAGTTFAVARSDRSLALRLFRPQMGAAAVAFLSGLWLWHTLHGGAFAAPERTLAVGVLAALAAAGVQGASRSALLRRLAASDASSESLGATPGQRVAAALLGITLICMASARFA